MNGASLFQAARNNASKKHKKHEWHSIFLVLKLLTDVLAGRFAMQRWFSFRRKQIVPAKHIVPAFRRWLLP